MTLNSLLAVVTLYHLAVALAWTYCTHSDTAHARIQLLQWRGKMSLPGFGSTGSVASCGIAPATSLPIPPSCGSSLNLLHWLWHGSRSQSNFYSDVAKCRHLALVLPALSLAVVPPPPIPPSCGSSLNLLHWLWHGSRSQSNFYSDVAKCRHLALVLPALSLAVVPPPPLLTNTNRPLE